MNVKFDWLDALFGTVPIIRTAHTSWTSPESVELISLVLLRCYHCFIQALRLSLFYREPRQLNEVLRLVSEISAFEVLSLINFEFHRMEGILSQGSSG